ncbi:MAG TPA: citramalate synthase, partial [Armatimonadetes bacterium]|nr:citramalate synthase [Armatimonadota bacterium]
GYGERCGNADLCAVIPNLKLKLGVDCVSDEDLRKLRDVSYFVSEVANMPPDDHRPFVGRSAFAHKGGVHVSAVLRHPRTYEHIEPERVGNERRFVVSELSGGSNIVAKAREIGLELDKASPVVREVLREVKELESQGYQFEGAEGSFELLLRRRAGQYRKLFDILHMRVIVEKRGEEVVAEATLKLKVGEKVEHTVAEGDGPVHALDNALRKALERHFPELSDIRLTDFKVRVVDSPSGTAAKVRVLLESRDKDGTAWTTIGVSTNIIEASWQALCEGIEYGLLRRREWK